ncbi:MAG: SGNH/GDSL hydrolase family protein [Lactococcus sp.]
MNKMKKIVIQVAGFLLATLLIFTALWFSIPKAGNLLTNKTTSIKNQKNIKLVAIGDSLTEGVGDTTKQGGFVPLFAKAIENSEHNTITVSTQNFGKAGDTSTQIYKRMTTNTKIQKALKTADVITLTVGGNDVLKVFRDNITEISNMSEKDFEKPAEIYQKQVEEIFAQIRKVNPNAQIYVLGIYNPFYLNFPDIKAFQNIIDNWNAATEKVVKAQQRAYFVPINNLLYKGADGQAVDAVESSKTSTDEIVNELLYSGDHFHPNNTGYQIMADAVFERYVKENH